MKVNVDIGGRGREGEKERSCKSVLCVWDSHSPPLLFLLLFSLTCVRMGAFPVNLGNSRPGLLRCPHDRFEFLVAHVHLALCWVHFRCERSRSFEVRIRDHEVLPRRVFVDRLIRCPPSYLTSRLSFLSNSARSSIAGTWGSSRIGPTCLSRPSLVVLCEVARFTPLARFVAV